MKSKLIDIYAYMRELLQRVQSVFGDRLLYLGLQGSHSRGDAGPDSDIDIFIVLDTLTVADLDAYKKIISVMNHADKSCGFISGQKELAHWNPCEICQLLNETQDYFGELKPLLPPYTDADIRCYIKIAVGNLYHQLCHNYIHSQHSYSLAELKQAYKSVFYILQNCCYLQTGRFILLKQELLDALKGSDHDVLKMAIALKEGKSDDFVAAYSLLFGWCQQLLTSF